MLSLRRGLLIFAAIAATTACAFGKESLAFTVSMPQPSNHTFHVVLRCGGLKGELHDFKMPVWSPGYYGIGDYSGNLSNFHAQDGASHSLPWERVTKNTWRVVAGNASLVEVSYDIFGNTSFAANTYLGEDRAYISPSGLFLHLPDAIHHPVTIAIQLPPAWKQIATGLEPVKNKPGTFVASDFDVLYDCPLLIGNQESLKFDVKGVPHYVAMENVPQTVDRPKMLADLQRMVTATTQLIGDVPYRHYTFLLMGRGNGGIEHLNSASIQFHGADLATPDGYLKWLSYVCHEYFHNFNVKRIRPLALGPFNYDMENLTDMLWVSEGLSVYYEDLVLVRAGLMTRQQYLDKMQTAIAAFENLSGHHYQSATEASWNTWSAGSGIGGDRNTTISYYDNGAMLGAMLDLKIRQSSQNRRSLDDVMRALYRIYYLRKKRGFTDLEFRQECETAAGAPLADVLDYAATTNDVDYARYFIYAGLQLETTAQEAPGAWLGVNTHAANVPPNRAPAAGARGGRGAAPETALMVTSVTSASPADRAGFQAGDQILEVEGVTASPKVINDLMTAKKPDDTVHVKILRGNSGQVLPVRLGQNTKRTFVLRTLPNPSATQAAILEDWLRTVQ